MGRWYNDTRKNELTEIQSHLSCYSTRTLTWQSWIHNIWTVELQYRWVILSFVKVANKFLFMSIIITHVKSVLKFSSPCYLFKVSGHCYHAILPFFANINCIFFYGIIVCYFIVWYKIDCSKDLCRNSCYQVTMVTERWQYKSVACQHINIHIHEILYIVSLQLRNIQSMDLHEFPPFHHFISPPIYLHVS